MAIDTRDKLIIAMYQYTKTAQGDPIDAVTDTLIERAEFYLRNEEIPGLKTDPETNAAFRAKADADGNIKIPSNVSSIISMYSKDPLVQYNRTSFRQLQLERDEYYYSNINGTLEGDQGSFAEMGSKYHLYPKPEVDTDVYLHYYAALTNLGSKNGFDITFTTAPSADTNITLPIVGDFAVTTEDTVADIATRYAAAVITSLGTGFAKAEAGSVRVYSEDYTAGEITTTVTRTVTGKIVETNALLKAAPDVYLSALLWKAFQWKGNQAMAQEFYNDMLLGLEKLRAARTRATKEGGRRVFKNRFLPRRRR